MVLLQRFCNQNLLVRHHPRINYSVAGKPQKKTERKQRMHFCVALLKKKKTRLRALYLGQLLENRDCF